MEAYFEKRRHEPYYKYVRTLLGILSCNAKSVCDVGSNGTDMISWLPCQEKVSIDLRNPLYADGVQLIVSVPYKWAKGFCKYHKQDPVDESKLAEWFANSSTTLKPVFSRVIYNSKKFRNGENIGRLVVVFASSYISESLSSLNEADNWLIRYND